MPVKMWTGLPGAGKTAAMVAAILQFKKDNPERPVFAINVNGLDESVATPITLEQLHQWWELPPGALICIDECQEDEFFPLDRGQPPHWVKRISKVRHEGMDFWMTTQHPALMSGYVRRLVDQHVHSVRKFNTKVVQRFTWGRCMESCEKGAAQKVAVSAVGTLPAEVFDLYKSSNAHNMKRRIPVKAWVLPIAALVALVAVIAVPLAIKKLQHHNEAVASGQVGVSGDRSGARPSVDQTMRSTDYAKWVKPRVDGVPWSAPMFDDLKVQAQPRLYCVAVEDGRCGCVTEQGTRYVVKPSVCRVIASDGLYNPYVGPLDSVAGARQGGRPGEPKAPPGRPAEPLGVGLGTVRAESAFGRAYVPPEFTPPNA